MYFMDIVEEEKEIARKEALEEGREIGIEEGKNETYKELIHKKLSKKITIEQIAEDLEISVDDVKSYMQV